MEDEGAHSIILDFLYNSSTIDEVTVTITDGDVEKTGYVTLHDCNEVDHFLLCFSTFLWR